MINDNINNVIVSINKLFDNHIFIINTINYIKCTLKTKMYNYYYINTNLKLV